MLNYVKYFVKAFILIMLFYIILYSVIGKHSLVEALEVFFYKNALSAIVVIICVILLDVFFLKKKQDKSKFGKK